MSTDPEAFVAEARKIAPAFSSIVSDLTLRHPLNPCELFVLGTLVAREAYICAVKVSLHNYTSHWNDYLRSKALEAVCKAKTEPLVILLETALPHLSRDRP